MALLIRWRGIAQVLFLSVALMRIDSVDQFLADAGRAIT